MLVVTAFFHESLRNTTRTRGMVAANVTAFSLDRHAAKMAAAPAYDSHDCFVSIERKRSNRPSSENNSAAVSSSPLMLATTSTCTGCTVKMMAPTNAAKRMLLCSTPLKSCTRQRYTSRHVPAYAAMHKAWNSVALPWETSLTTANTAIVSGL